MIYSKWFGPALLFMLAVSSSYAYWQQEVGYEMQVHLDTEAHELKASSQLRYINHSPDTLSRSNPL